MNNINVEKPLTHLFSNIYQCYATQNKTTKNLCRVKNGVADDFGQKQMSHGKLQLHKDVAHLILFPCISTK